MWESMTKNCLLSLYYRSVIRSFALTISQNNITCTEQYNKTVVRNRPYNRGDQPLWDGCLTTPMFGVNLIPAPTPDGFVHRVYNEVGLGTWVNVVH